MDLLFQSIIKNIIEQENELLFREKTIETKWISDGITINDIIPLKLSDNIDMSVEAINSSERNFISHYKYSSSYNGGVEPVLINAPTGSGKSTFVINQLATDAAQQTTKIQNGQIQQEIPGKVLFLSNRKALNIQQRKESQRTTQMPRSAVSQLSNNSTYRNIISYTYQGFWIAYKARRINLNEIRYVVLDEAHFFCSDAPFNSRTENILCTIIQTFYSIPRIYMTATAGFVKPIIAAYERFYYGFRIFNHFLDNYPIFKNQMSQYFQIPIQNQVSQYYQIPSQNRLNQYYQFVQYYFGFINQYYSQPGTIVPVPIQEAYPFSPCHHFMVNEFVLYPNYDNVSVNFFDEWSEISDFVLQEQQDKNACANKWLIFVSSKDVGNQLKKMIGSNLAKYVDASSKSRNELERKLINTERFASKVLISTTIFYNGVNFKDEKLTRVVVDFSDRDTLIQMLGRKRRSAEEHVKLFVRIPDKETINGRFNHAQMLIDYLDQFRKDQQIVYDDFGELSKDQQRLFVTEFYSVECNYLADYQLRALSGFYEEIKDESEFDPLYYPRLVCEWLGKEFDPSMMLSEYEKESSITTTGTIQKADAPTDLPNSDCAQELIQICEELLNGQDSVTTDEETRKNLLSALHECCQSHGIMQKIYGYRSEGGREKKTIINILTKFNLPFELENKHRQNKGEMRFSRTTDKT